MQRHLLEIRRNSRDSRLHYAAYATSIEYMRSGVSRHRMMLMEAALRIRRRRGVAPIRQDLFDVIFGLTPAERAVVLIDNSLWERERADPEERAGTRRSIIEDVFKNGAPVIAEDQSTVVFRWCF